MAVTQVKLKYSSKQGTGDREGRRQYTRVYLVQTDSDAGTTEKMVADDPRIPGAFTPFAPDPGAMLVRKRARQIDRLVWEVTCEYDSKHEGEDEKQNPLDRPPKISYGFVQYQTNPTKDTKNKPYITSAKQPLEEHLIAIDESRLILTIEKNLATFPVAQAEAYQDAINDKDWTFQGVKYKKHTAKVASIRGADAWENNVHYWAVVLEIHINRKTWQRMIVDKGEWWYEAKADGSPGVGTESLKHKEDFKVFLDGQGGKQPDGWSGPPVELTFDPYPEKDFNLLLQ